MIGKTIYEIQKDEMREATQEDVDEWAKGLQVSGKMVRVLRHLMPGLVPPSSATKGFVDELDEKLTAYIKAYRIP